MSGRSRVLVVLCLAGLASACAMIAPGGVPPTALRLDIGAGKVAEECFSMAEGERIDYQFSATVAVDFNVHTHRGQEIVTPVDNRQTKSQSGTYAAPRREDYCMMWTNKSAVPALVTGEWRRVLR